MRLTSSVLLKMSMWKCWKVRLESCPSLSFFSSHTIKKFALNISQGKLVRLYFNLPIKKKKNTKPIHSLKIDFFLHQLINFSTLLRWAPVNVSLLVHVRKTLLLASLAHVVSLFLCLTDWGAEKVNNLANHCYLLELSCRTYARRGYFYIFSTLLIVTSADRNVRATPKLHVFQNVMCFGVGFEQITCPLLLSLLPSRILLMP